MPPPSIDGQTLDVRRVAVVVNGRAGSRQAEMQRGELAAAFDRLDVTATFVEVADADALRAAVDGSTAAFDVVVAAGGDGTVNTVANALAAASRDRRAPPPPPMGIVAFGTFNYVARRYALGESLEAAVHTVVDGRTVGIPAGEVGGRLFLNNCSLGLYTSIIDARERHKRMFGRSRWVALASGLATLLGGHSRPWVRIVGEDGLHRMLRASLVFVGANPLQLTELDPAVAQRVEEGALALVIVRALGWKRLFGLAWRSLAGAPVTDAPEIVADTVQSVTLALRRRRVRLVVDGELLVLPTPLDVRWHRQALRLRVPGEPAAAAGEGRPA